MDVENIQIKSLLIMSIILLGIVLIFVAIAFNKIGNSHLKEPIDCSEYYNYAAVAYAGGILLIQLGCVLAMLRYTEGV